MQEVWRYCLTNHGATLIQYHSETAQGEVRGQGIDDPLMTVDGSNRYGLVTSFLEYRNKDSLSTRIYVDYGRAAISGVL